ncbi:PREDICTED: uncharacterized protein C3orf20-like isoform X2 [Priapulus caudatus]|uniref:Uncharacterized protein C3orf20-like isoform X2 n=1 Tax=Priapulus caudatus TaxID=37621 RepID=A0ABM1EN86_PRICU|nr:PREDICTED: uncharacterized protein C3orf20-like isoform X2 [Priapulus caudatus]
MDRGSSQLKQRLLMTTAADGSCFVYYPSGRLAICRSDSGTGSGHYYTYVYDDGPDATLLAMFTPLQHGCCNYKQGGIRLICNALGGHINDYNGSATRVWNWPAAGKLRSRVYLQLNEFMSVSCESSAHMTVLFSCQNEKLSFSVGWEEEVTKSGCRMQDDERHKLHFGSELSSKTRSHIPLSTVVLAAQLESHKDMRSRSSRTSSTKPLGKAVKQLPEQPGFTPLCHFGPDLSEELSNLREQVSIIVKCWAQFYRGVVGIASSAKPDCSNANLRAGTLSRSYCARPRSPSHLARSAKRKEIVHKRPKTAPAGCLPSAHRSAYGGGGSWSVHGMMGQRQPLLGTCPVVLRTKLLGNNTDGMKCKCSRIHIPFLMDIEYTEFIRNGMPVEQLLIVQVIDSRCQANTNVDRMLTEKYHAANKLRFQPCMESTDQLYRLARYDMAVAMQSTEHTEALLHRVHNVRPGTFLMYLAGRLVFCDYMFNGYGVTCRDFDKQLRSTLAAASAGHQLPANFKFSMNSSQPCSTSWDRQPRWKDDRTGYNNRRRPKSIVL